MKIFGSQNSIKSWSLSLKNGKNVGVTKLVAVDSETGSRLCTVLTFTRNGDVKLKPGVKQALSEKGYDPNEHRNSYDWDGRLKVILD